MLKKISLPATTIRVRNADRLHVLIKQNNKLDVLHRSQMNIDLSSRRSYLIIPSKGITLVVSSVRML
ncbi:hypothetical protein L2E82_37455 [Cichorium intybus]|uniref:Uncharacterized protein n=1 Tax=Cichorium intybus TaxID=13427 RepID=A0ACB9AFZ1_CICIN|nr:hypothetical protein L2E82_37455 [Cichorium intybus]